MNYKRKFSEIVEKIGEKNEIKGIDRIFKGGDGYFSITAQGLEITRGCNENNLHKVEFWGEGWDRLDNFSEKIKEWFSYVESMVDACVPSEVIVNGRKYKLIE